MHDAELDRLTALASPQPPGPLLQPLRLTGAAAALPATGVLCTAGGVGIDLLQMRVGFGDPALQALADPRVTFFELPTGQWPMLSCTAYPPVRTRGQGSRGRGCRRGDARGAE